MLDRRMVMVVVVVALSILCGCSQTRHARNVETSGFLAHAYPLMHEGKKGESLLIYRNSKFFKLVKTYKKIQLDPVTIWRGKKSQFEGVSQADLQNIANRFYSTLYLELEKDYEMVDHPDPDTFRMQVAITKVEEGTVALEVMSKVVPKARMASTAKTILTGKPAFVGEASIEGKLTDASTGELMAAAVDRRVGGKHLNADSFDSWGDVYHIMDFWSKGIRFKLCQQRGGTNCTPPEKSVMQEISGK